MLTVKRQLSLTPCKWPSISSSRGRRFESRFARGFPALTGTRRFTVSLARSPLVIAGLFRTQLGSAGLTSGLGVRR